ncbi:hypothetical protein PR048_011164 [Dryococelus australis]|uniref:HAT C-terminal dimerisation domain-containing protein n=1 Tax=Dryococelus australis TaxID=614101 RepID=A0ABQ9HKT1_9NEOP|nr:hypothetical protein PR048_011164 [Dryococelus australis]
MPASSINPCDNLRVTSQGNQHGSHLWKASVLPLCPPKPPPPLSLRRDERNLIYSAIILFLRGVFVRQVSAVWFCDKSIEKPPISSDFIYITTCHLLYTPNSMISMVYITYGPGVVSSVMMRPTRGSRTSEHQNEALGKKKKMLTSYSVWFAKRLLILTRDFKQLPSMQLLQNTSGRLKQSCPQISSIFCSSIVLVVFLVNGSHCQQCHLLYHLYLVHQFCCTMLRTKLQLHNSYDSLPQDFSLGSNKAHYLITDALAPYFKKLQVQEMEGFLIMLFYDETTNAAGLKKLQTDVRYWLNNTKQLFVRTWKPTAPVLVDKINDAMAIASLPSTNLLMLGSDGLNVNKAVAGLINNQLLVCRRKPLIDIGTCNIHVVHNAFLKGLEQLRDVSDMSQKVPQDGSQNKRIDLYWLQFMEMHDFKSCLKYPTVIKIVKTALLLLHGNTDAERSYSSSSRALTCARSTVSERTLNALMTVTSTLLTYKSHLIPKCKELLDMGHVAHTCSCPSSPRPYSRPHCTSVQENSSNLVSQPPHPGRFRHQAGASVASRLYKGQQVAGVENYVQANGRQHPEFTRVSSFNFTSSLIPPLRDVWRIVG